MGVGGAEGGAAGAGSRTSVGEEDLGEVQGRRGMRDSFRG